MKILDNTHASTSVNQAPWGILVSAAERYTPSRAAKTMKTAKTRKGLRRQMMRATMATMQVVMKVTRMTQTP